MSEKQCLHFQYPSKISDIVSINDSFDSCKLAICYAGKNRNGSVIPKHVIEAALPTMPYCPVVTHYDIDNDSFGGHDMRVVSGEDGDMKLVNLTDAIGVIPADPEWYWDDNEDGHSYLCTKALIWKRAAAYDSLIANGVTAQSMEINVNAGHMSDEGYVIDNFTFTAFAVIGVEPCFEDARVEFSFNSMLEDFKREFSQALPIQVIPASADDNITQLDPKGGETEMNIDELLAKFGLSAEDVADIDMTDMDEAAIESRFAEIAEAKNQLSEDADDTTEVFEESDPVDPEPAPEADDEPAQPEEFSLMLNQLNSEICAALHTVRYQDEYWGDMPRYWYVDCDVEAHEVYCYDEMDDHLYGMTYTMDGDHVVIDFASAKRKKVVYADFDEGGAANFSLVSEVMTSVREKYSAIVTERDELRTFRDERLNADRMQAINSKLDEFADLAGNEMFEALRLNNDGMTVEQVESRCFEIRGRMGAAKFAMAQEAPVRIPVERKVADNEPYGGIFAEYGIGTRN